MEKKNIEQKNEKAGKRLRELNKITYLICLQTTECCGGAPPALVILHAAVQTTAVVRFIQSVCVCSPNTSFNI